MPGEALDYLSPITRSLPIAFTLEVSGLGYSFHFINNEGFWQFPNGMTDGFFQRFMSEVHPLARYKHLIGFEGLELLTKNNIWRYVRAAVSGINRLFNFINDFRNFRDATGKIDFSKQLQTFSAIRLIFADLAALNATSHAHQRIQFSMSLIDKLANLKYALGKHEKTNEDILAKQMPSISQGIKVKEIIEYALTPYNEEFAKVLGKCALNSFQSLHEHLSNIYGETKNENILLDRLRSQRNMRHGTFLRKEQFSDLFEKSSGTIPSEIVSLPFWLVLSLTFDPEKFLFERP